MRFRSLNEDEPVPVLTSQRFCGKCGAVTEWAKDPEFRSRCIAFRDGEHCLYDGVELLTDAEAERFVAHVGVEPSAPVYFFT